MTFSISRKVVLTMQFQFILALTLGLAIYHLKLKGIKSIYTACPA